MHNLHKKNTIRYYLLIAFFLLILFLSNDFGLTDVQKTAIIVSVGIDKEGEDFLLTSQIAIPHSSKQGQASEVVQLGSRGKTIGEAFEEINAKTGWYPKLVFCNLIVLGKSIANENVFDALDFFLRDEYLTDNCLVATCDGTAKEIIDTSALVEDSSATAINKVLSEHAKRVGAVLPNTLKNFSIGYFGESASGYLPILKKEPQQEPLDEEKSQKTSTNANEDSQQSAQKEKEDKKKPVFSAGETALFVKGKRVGTLNKTETFALSAVQNRLRLASYSLKKGEETCILTIKQNSPKISLRSKDKLPLTLDVSVTMSAGILDFSKSQPLEEITDIGDVPPSVFPLAEKQLSKEIESVFEKCKRLNCDLFGVRERLIKYEKRHLKKYKDVAFQNTQARVAVTFRNVR